MLGGGGLGVGMVGEDGEVKQTVVVSGAFVKVLG